jgi:Xaa-Pro aminopeptidase
VKQSSWVKNISTYARWIDPVQITMDVIKRFTKNSRAKIGIESASRYLTPLQYSQLEFGLRPAELVDASAIVPRLMLIKSPTEIKYIKNAAKITVSGMKAAIDAVAVGKTDNYIASIASQTLIAEGSEYMSSDPIVCVGQNSSIPHGHYANRKVGRGDTVLLEMSACVQRYSAPLMRSVSLGKPNIEVAKMADTCKLALNSVIGRMRPGSLFQDAASTGKKVIERAGSSLVFHGTYAYSIGLGFPGTSWADAPVEVRDDENGVFEEGMVFHLPMSLRDPGRTGVAFSETVVITSDGCKVLTEMEQEFSIK